MATTDTTTILSIDPLQDTMDCYQDHHSLLEKSQVSCNEMASTLSTHSHLATSPNSTLSSSSSSMRASRLSLPSLWNSSAPLDSPTYASSSASSLWSSPLGRGDISSACTASYDNDQEKRGLGDPQQQLQSLDSFIQGRHRWASFNHPTSKSSSCFDQPKKLQWQDSTNGNIYGQHSTNDCVDWLGPSNYTTSCHPLRSIWSTSMEQQQQPTHQRRMSLSNDLAIGDLSVPNSHQRDMNQAYSCGRRHSLAGPLVNKSPTHSNNSPLNARQSYPGMMNGGYYSMAAIDEFNTPTMYNNAQYSRQRQLELNKKILDHIDEYFGGGGSGGGSAHNNQRNPSSPSHSGASSSMNHSLQQYDMSAAMASYSNNMGKTMTAGGDAANFGSSTVLMGKGIPLHHFLNSSTMLYVVEFKAGRTDICYVMQGDHVLPKIGDLVIVEADRGHDLGKVTTKTTANDIMRQHQQHRGSTAGLTNSNDGDSDGDDNKSFSTKEVAIDNSDKLPPTPPLATHDTEDDDSLMGAQKLHAKRLYRLANAEETISLATKTLDEEKALTFCRAKIQQKELPMQVVNAEYQWDRRKLTFYFMAEQRIDFRELVRELFKNYKTRIWMCVVKPDSNGGDSSMNE